MVAVGSKSESESESKKESINEEVLEGLCCDTGTEIDFELSPVAIGVPVSLSSDEGISVSVGFVIESITTNESLELPED